MDKERMDNELQAYIESVACYVRVSTQEQKLHGLSLDAQKEKLIDYAEKHNLRIVEWYIDEGVSGRKPIKKRPEMQRMIHDAQKGKFQRIIFIKLDRFFRSVAEYHECMKLIDPVVWTATEEKYDLSTANGRAFVNMKITIAELEADQTSERIKLVNEYKVKSGLPLFGSQSFPFCYTVAQPAANERNKYVTKTPEYKDLMMDLIEHVEDNRSIKSAMVYINNKYGTKFSYNAISKALRNEMICGYYQGNPNYCEPYITRERFEALQKGVKLNPRTTENRVYLFSGLIKCPDCGRSLTGTTHVINRPNNRHYVYKKYRCNGAHKDAKCKFGRMIDENVTERLLLENLGTFLAEAKERKFQIEEENNKVSKYNLNDLQAELDRLNYSWQKGRIKDAEEYDRKYDALMEQINAATEEIVHLSDEPDYDRIEGILVSGWQEVYKELDDENKRAFWRSFIEEIHYDCSDGKKEIVSIKFF